MAETITLNIAERNYPVKAEDREKESLRKAEELIRERMMHYSRHYPSSDRQDHLAMSLLSLTLQHISNGEKAPDAQEELRKELEQSERYLSDYLGSL